MIVYRALAKAELKAPAPMQGAFIAARNTFDAFAIVRKVLSAATADVLIVDRYMDEVTLIDFTLLAPDGIPIRLLADGQGRRATLKPAVRRWQTTYQTRPLEARLSPPRTLHDRLILVDRNVVRGLSQSFNAFASRAHASISRFDGDTAAIKRGAYESLWQKATPL
jgi:hypothetical protein